MIILGSLLKGVVHDVCRFFGAKKEMNIEVDVGLLHCLKSFSISFVNNQVAPRSTKLHQDQARSRHKMKRKKFKT